MSHITKPRFVACAALPRPPAGGVGSRPETSMKFLRASITALLVLGLSACGFQLRGLHRLPFESLYINMPESSELGAALKRSIRASGPTTTPDTREKAQAILEPLGDGREKVILSLNAAGRAREYQLRQRFAFRVVDGKGAELVPPSEINLTREITFSDAQLLAKEQEEVLLYRDMQNDLVQQILRRIAAARPVTTTPATPK